MDSSLDKTGTSPLVRPSSPSSSVRSSASCARGRSGSRSRRNSTAADGSYYSEMAQEGVFDGPAPDAVPSSISSFAHHSSRRHFRPSGEYSSPPRSPVRSRSRSSSISSQRSFRFFNTAAVERANDIDRQLHPQRFEYSDVDQRDRLEAFADRMSFAADDDLHSLHTVGTNQTHRFSRESAISALDDLRTHGFNRADSTSYPLLEPQSSFDIHSPHIPLKPEIPRVYQQTVYLPEEDLILALAGYNTNRFRLVLFTLLSVCTGGIAYLIIRWFPKLRVSIVGDPAPLSDCSWVVLENQWGELSFHNITKLAYHYPLSTIFLIPSDPTKLDDDPIVDELMYFDYRYMRLIFNPLEGTYQLNTDWKDTQWEKLQLVRKGLDDSPIHERELVFGQNCIDIKGKSIPRLLVDEILHPFYIFQIFSMVLWGLDQYYYYAACIFLISVISIGNTLLETKSNMARLREISRFVCNVRVLRDGFWTTIDSTQMVPGDIYEVSDPSLATFPCDSILLSGDAIVNESMLTGESIPVTKGAATHDTMALLQKTNLANLPADLAKSFLFCGTKIVRVRKPAMNMAAPSQQVESEDFVATALAIRTGFNTTKGALVRSMLFPKPSGFKFYRDSFRYIGFMAALALLGFVFYTATFIRLHLPARLIAFRSLDLITIVVPPALPATLTIGTNIALARLKQKNIFCISPNRVNVGGKLDIVCFDKTGTLTEEGLDVLGVHTVNRHESRFSSMMPTAESVVPRVAKHVPTKWAQHLTLLYAMATCHSLRLVDGELLGDPLDYRMFHFTGWSYEEDGSFWRPEQDSDEESSYTPQFRNDLDRENGESQLAPTIIHPPPGLARLIIDEANEDIRQADLGIIKTFEFAAHLRRMSVVVKRYRDADMHVYVKGAPEVMSSICKPDSFPADYDEVLDSYTHNGYRVIAVATKVLKRMPWHRAQKLKREDVESELEFAGFIVFENKLKPSTKGIILELEDANIRTVMCTGDNVLTAISVAKECGLVSDAVPIYVPHIIIADTAEDEIEHVEEDEQQQDTVPEVMVRWECIDNPRMILDNATLFPIVSTIQDDAQSMDGIAHERQFSKGQKRDYVLAVTGEVFRYMMNHGSVEATEQMLMRGSIYARMSPDEKHELVEKLQEIDYSVCFCGDGANDCGALKAADVGISLSEAEASVAAPFTSRVFEITCVPDVIREGRASLVTSFSCFKYMSLYSAIQFVTVGILYESGTNLGDFQFLLIDMFLILPIAVFMGWARPYPKLSRKRPTANLVSIKILVKLVGQIIICGGFQFIVWTFVKREPWYEPPVTGSDDNHVQSSDNTSLFLASCFQYIFVAVILSVGPPYREPMSQNKPFLVTIFMTALIVTYILVMPPKWLFKLLVLTEMAFEFKAFIVLLAMLNFGMSMVADRFILDRIAISIRAIRRTLQGGRRKIRKRYKVLMEADNFERFL
ncbi:uncharacterized protein V1516DRAFT_711632 [Lipomyces oligophaga]|uniref:uncharacterized protein n=1 Tax=Lipomyces oligophaga TaxID=45792 RepID=UPI0034CD5A44